MATGGDTLVVVLHVHLLPALMPLIWRGARVVTVMLGIEVWKPLRPLEPQHIALPGHTYLDPLTHFEPSKLGIEQALQYLQKA